MADLRADDADIDQLFGAVVGGTGAVIEFPTPPAGAEKKRGKAAASSRVEKLSAELAEQLEQNQAEDEVAAERPVIDPRTVPVRFSNLKHIARSPLHYWDAVQADREDTLAMRLGRGAHAMVLGEPVVRWDGGKRDPRSKAWKDFQAKHAGKEILNAKEWAQAEGMANAIRRHPIAADLLLAEHVIREQQFEWEWLGRRCSSRPDARTADGRIVTDFKTTQCAEPQKFMRDATWRAYNAQLAFYALAVHHLIGREPAELYAVAVESKRPYPVTVLRLTDRARIQGEKLCRIWMERLLACEASNHWPPYTDAIVSFEVPSDGDPDAAVDVEELDEEFWA